MNKVVWTNLNDSVVDLSVLEAGFNELGIKLVKEKIETEEVDRQIALSNTADAVISVAEVWNKEIVDRIHKKPRLIMRYGAGVDNINIPDMTEAGIAVANIPGQNSAAVAEIALLHILNLGRRFTYGINGSKQGLWPTGVTGRELDEKTIGLIGFGNIAKHLVRYLSGFKVKIRVYDKYLQLEQSKKAYPQIVFFNNLDEMVKDCDVISFHLPLNEETKGICDSNFMNLLKDRSFIINTSRGALINEADLIKALDSGKIAGAGLDVLAAEPPLISNPLLNRADVFVSGHMGAGSLEAEMRSQRVMVETISKYFSGEIMKNVINREENSVL